MLLLNPEMVTSSKSAETGAGAWIDEEQEPGGGHAGTGAGLCQRASAGGGAQRHITSIAARSIRGSSPLEHEQVPRCITDEDARNGGSASGGAAWRAWRARAAAHAVAAERGEEELRPSRSMERATAELGIPLHAAHGG
jgi:hypothetical protein